MLPRSLYNTLLCQAFSPCGRYLAVGNSYGQIAIFNLDKAVNPKTDNPNENCRNAEYIIDVNRDAQICSMVTVNSFLIVGSSGLIDGWDWKSLVNLKPSKPSWKIKIPENKQNIDVADVNSLWWNEELELLFAGCGDDNIYAFDIGQGKLRHTFTGHTDYIHAVKGLRNHLISASEDGSVKLWDIRTEKMRNEFKPYTNDKVARSDLGKWIGDVSLSDDWIVCGGGPKLSLWHQRSLHSSLVFDLPDHGIHVSYFYDDKIVAAGAARHLYQLNYSGEVVIQIPVSATTVYSAIQQTDPYFVFTIVGSSPDVDLCTTNKYKDMTLHFN